MAPSDRTPVDRLPEQVLAIVMSVAGPDRTPPTADPDTPLRDGGFWLDSLPMVEIVLACEAHFRVALDDEWDTSHEALFTARTMAEVIRGKLDPTARPG